MALNSRRPLSNIPNGANSPCRLAAAPPAASKRSRSQSSVQREMIYGQVPPAKKQMISKNHATQQTPSRQRAPLDFDGGVFARRTSNARTTAFNRRLIAAREKSAQVKQVQDEKALNENLENVRQWQKHYRKAFPQFVFYFENVAEDVRLKCSKQILNLGAQEVKFFSKDVTHVVTTRPIPPELDATTSTEAGSRSASTSQGDESRHTTINPSVLERSSELAQTQLRTTASNAKSGLAEKLGRKPQLNSRSALQYSNGELRKQQTFTADVLSKARTMGMKIWALEKLQRILTAMFDTDTGSHFQQDSRNHVSNHSVAVTKSRAETHLSRLLQHERVNGPTDRDCTVATKEMIQFKGPFIYIHDLFEQMRPVMVREYPKVANREDGAWPQFRSVSHGKCPFIEETAGYRRGDERQRAREEELERNNKKENNVASRTRAALANGTANMQPPQHGPTRSVLTRDPQPRQVFDGQKPSLQATVSVQAERSAAQDAVHQSVFGAKPSVTHGGPAARLLRGEPVASGVQPSNITSAIRSQMISSTAAAPGAKAGTNKEVYELKRKLLAKQGGQSTTISSSRMNTVNAGIDKCDTSFRVAKQKAQQKLGCVEEDEGLSETEYVEWDPKPAGKMAWKTKKAQKKDPKPGYCENCRDKFDDFDDHILSRNHRRFALNDKNWADLDSLLTQLGRPLKDV